MRPRKWLGQHKILTIFLILNVFLIGWTAYFSYSTRSIDIYASVLDGQEVIRDTYVYLFDVHAPISPTGLQVPYELEWSAVQINATAPVNITVSNLFTEEVYARFNDTTGTGILNHSAPLQIYIESDSNDPIQIRAQFWWLREVVYYHWEDQIPWGRVGGHLLGFGVILIAVVDISFLIAMTFVIRSEMPTREEDYDEE
jgi:hypothetical protein